MNRLGRNIFVAVMTFAATGLGTTAWASAEVGEVGKVVEGGAMFFAVCAGGAAFCIAIAAFGSAMAMGRSIDKALEGIARQPEAVKDIQLNMIIGLALIETLAIYALLVCIFLLFANPFTQYFVA